MMKKYLVYGASILCALPLSGMQDGIRFDHIEEDVRSLLTSPPQEVPSAIAMKARLMLAQSSRFPSQGCSYSAWAWDPRGDALLACTNNSICDTNLAWLLTDIPGEKGKSPYWYINDRPLSAAQKGEMVAIGNGNTTTFYKVDPANPGNTMQLFQAASTLPITVLRFDQTGNNVMACAHSQDNGDKDYVKIIDLEQQKVTLNVLQQHGALDGEWRPSSEHNVIAIANWSPVTISLLDARTGGVTGTIKTDDGTYSPAVTWLNEHECASGGTEGIVRVFDVRSLQEVRQLFSSQRRYITDVRADAVSGRVGIAYGVGQDQPTVAVVDAQSGKLEYEISNVLGRLAWQAGKLAVKGRDEIATFDCNGSDASSVLDAYILDVWQRAQAARVVIKPQQYPALLEAFSKVDPATLAALTAVLQGRTATGVMG